jgi:hypothetical protein
MNEATVGTESPVTSSDGVGLKRATHWARFLYTENPFYLISCFLILYGIQLMAVNRPTALSRAIVMSSSIAFYAVVMAITVIAVVRLAKVWQDARSIFLVVLIALAAYSSGFDETCVNDPQMAWWFAGAGGVLTFCLIESVVRGCRLRLAAAYRVAMYAMFVVFMFAPPIFGGWVRSRNEAAAGWSSVIFSVAFAAAMLLLIPAMRRRGVDLRHNGSPWKWPAYPLAAFFILVVLAGIRVHAIWMSFGFYGRPVRFEPFLIMPLFFSGLILLAEVDLRRRKLMRPCATTAMFASPLLLLAAVNQEGATSLPIASSLAYYAGSAVNVSLGALIVLLMYLSLARLPRASTMMAGSVVVTAALMKIPHWMALAGIERWMLLLVAGAYVLVWLWSRISSDARCVLAWTVLSVALGKMFADRIEVGLAFVIATAFWTLGAMVIATIYDTELTQTIRNAAAVLMVIGSCLSIAWWNENQDSKWMVTSVLFAMTLLSVSYLFWIRRRGWMYVALAPVAVILLILTTDAFRQGQFRRVNWPLSGGVVCLATGLAVTTAKTNWIKNRHQQPMPFEWLSFRPGL